MTTTIQTNNPELRAIMAASETMSDIEDIAYNDETGYHHNLVKIKPPHKLCVVYSTDSLFSTVAAATMKRILEERLPEHLAKFYHVEFIEVANLYINNVADSYIWLGMGPVNEAVERQQLSKFLSARHASIEKNFSSKQPLSGFEEAILKLSMEDGRPIKYITGHTVPLTEAAISSHHVVGFITTALSRLSSVIPELELDDLDSSVISIARIENNLIAFNTRTASVQAIMDAWCAMHNSLRQLGHSYDRYALTGTDEEKLAAYIGHYRLVRAEIDKQNGMIHMFKEDNKRNYAAVTHFSKDFWLIRRVICMSYQWYHNSRLTHFGLHTESNMGAKAKTTVDKGRTVNSH